MGGAGGLIKFGPNVAFTVVPGNCRPIGSGATCRTCAIGPMAGGVNGMAGT